MNMGVETVKDIPIFTTAWGAASLILREIPYQKTSYVRLLTVNALPGLLKECVDFCRALGAEKIYASGEGLEAYPLHTCVLRLCCPRTRLSDTDAALFPVQDHTLEAWMRIYRQKVRSIPNGAWMTDSDGKKMLSDGSGYFVHRDGKLLGVGKLGEGSIEFLAATAPGAGEDVVKALTHGLFTEDVTLEVASRNTKAMALYQRLGFLPVQEISKWYKIF